MPPPGIVASNLHLFVCPRCRASGTLSILRTRFSTRHGYGVHIAHCSACRRLSRLPEIPRGALK